MAKIAVRSAGTPEAIKILDSDEMMVGRGSDCQIILADGCVSRQHCLLRKTPQGFRVYARRESNPTMVNGVVLEQQVLLRMGDVIRVGKTDLLYVVDANEFPEVAQDDGGDTFASQGAGGFEPVSSEDEDGLCPISEDEAAELRRELPPVSAPKKTAKNKPGFLQNVGMSEEHRQRMKIQRELLEQRKRNDKRAKIIIFLVFGLPTILIQALIIWYFVLREG